MFSNCKSDSPTQPKRSCIYEILDTLLINQNDYNRMIVEMKNLQAEFKIETKRMQFPCEEMKRVMCCKDFDKTKGESLTKQMGQMSAVYNCFTRRIEELNGHLKDVLESSQNCMAALSTSKDHLKRRHERNVEHLKCRRIKSRDPIKIAKYEDEICELQRLFAKEVTYIKQVESLLQPFFERLKAGSTREYVQGESFKGYDWIPAEKRFDAVDATANQIIDTMGSSLVNALAQLHIQQPSDVEGYLAAFLLNLERNQKLLQEKMELLKPQEIVTCELML